MIEFILHVVGLDVYQCYFKRQDGLPNPTVCPITMSSSTDLRRRVR